MEILEAQQDKNLSYEYFEAQRIDDFRQSIGNLAVRPLTDEIDVTPWDASEEAVREFMSSEYVYDSTFYAEPELVPFIEGEIEDFEPFMTSGTKQSTHGVFFGALVLKDNTTIDVAVKPYENHEGYKNKRLVDTLCAKDYFTNIAARLLGFENLPPAGFIFNSEGHAYSLTYLDTEIMSLEETDWTNYYSDNEEEAGNEPLWQNIAELAALLHSTGDSMHGDLAARNIVTNSQGQVQFIDWELGKLGATPMLDMEDRYGRRLQDMRVFTKSLADPVYLPIRGIGIFQGLNDDWRPAFKDLFFDHYTDMRLEIAGSGSHHMRKLKEAKEELKQLEKDTASLVRNMQIEHAPHTLK